MGRMNSLQKNLLQLLTELDEICKKHDIQYFLAGGTALGSVRNHCFLPWDDDIDIYIIRDDWNKLKNLIETEENILPEGRSLIYKENAEYYCNTIPRYVDHRSTAIYRSQAFAGKACGQHIDLLIMDPIPKDKEKKREYIDLLKVYTEMLFPYFVVNKKLSLEDMERHFKLYESYCKRADKEGEEKVLKELEEKLRDSASDEECDEYCMRWGREIIIYKKEHYGNGRYEIFEKKEFPVAERAEGIFRTAFGDSWMYIPEHERQIAHNALKDIEIPFHEYTDRYMPKINHESAFKKIKENKRDKANLYYYRKKVLSLVAKEKVASHSKNFTKRLNDKEDELRAILDDRDYASIRDEFKDYLNLQYYQSVRRYNIAVPISQKNLATLMLSMIGEGKYYEANKLLRIWKINEMPMSDELIEVERLIEFCRELSIARYDKNDRKLALDLIISHENKYPDLIDIYRSKAWIMESDADDKAKEEKLEDFKSIDELCSKALKLYPDDGEIMAFQAKAKLELGDRKEAMNLYNKAICNTRNGIIWQKIEDETGISRIDIERDIIEGKA